MLVEAMTQCMNGLGFQNAYADLESSIVSWYIWKSVDDHMVKIVAKGDVVEHIVNILPGFLEHC